MHRCGQFTGDGDVDVDVGDVGDVLSESEQAVNSPHSENWPNPINWK